MRYEFGALILVGDYTWRGLFSEFYGILIVIIKICAKMNNSPPAKLKQVVLVSRTTRQLPPSISQLIG